MPRRPLQTLFRASIPNAKLRPFWLAIACTCALVSCTASNPTISDTLPPPNPEIVQLSGQALPVEASVEIGGQTIFIEIARTPRQQQIGMMHRQRVPDECGMVFPMPVARPVRFWMKNVNVSLDMVFLRDGVVQAIAADVPPCESDPCPLYGPDTAIDLVLELRGGRAAELGLKTGDRLEFRALSPEKDKPNCSQL